MKLKDIILYIIGISTFVYVSLILSNTQARLEKSISDVSKTEYNSIQLEQTKIRYEYSSKILLSNSTRKNIAFLIGTMMIILGTILVISKIESTIDTKITTLENAKFNLTTTSPGVFVIFLGTIIVITTILKSDTYNFKDNPITTKTEYKKEPLKKNNNTDGKKSVNSLIKIN